MIKNIVIFSISFFFAIQSSGMNPAESTHTLPSNVLSLAKAAEAIRKNEEKIKELKPTIKLDKSCRNYIHKSLDPLKLSNVIALEDLNSALICCQENNNQWLFAYNLNSKLGSGVHGEVFHGSNVTFNDFQDVTIKKCIADDPIKLKVACQEADSTKKLKRLQAACLHNNNYYIVMDYNPGISMYDLIYEDDHEKLISQNLAKAIAIETLNAMVELHSENFVHLDIKPENIIIFIEPYDDQFGVSANFCDFATCCQAGSAPREFVGTEAYQDDSSLGFVVNKQIKSFHNDLFSWGIMTLDLLSKYDWRAYHLNARRMGVKGFVEKHIKEALPDVFLKASLREELRKNNPQLELLLRTALRCIKDNPIDRPTNEEIKQELHTLLSYQKKDNGLEELTRSGGTEKAKNSSPRNIIFGRRVSSDASERRRGSSSERRGSSAERRSPSAERRGSTTNNRSWSRLYSDTH